MAFAYLYKVTLYESGEGSEENVFQKKEEEHVVAEHVRVIQFNLLTRMRVDGFPQNCQWEAQNGECTFQAESDSGKVRKYVIREVCGIDKILLGRI